MVASDPDSHELRQGSILEQFVLLPRLRLTSVITFAIETMLEVLRNPMLQGPSICQSLQVCYSARYQIWVHLRLIAFRAWNVIFSINLFHSFWDQIVNSVIFLFSNIAYMSVCTAVQLPFWESAIL